MKFPLGWLSVMAMATGLALTNQTARAQDSTSSKNLLVNGTFEKGTDGWTLDPYEKHGQMTIDENEKHNSRSTLRIDNAVADDTHVKQKVSVEPDTRYRFEGYIKAKNVEPQKRESKEGACLALEGGFQKSLAINKTKSWTKVSFDFVTGNETEIELGARLGFFSNLTTGTAWFADLSVVKIGKAPPRR